MRADEEYANSKVRRKMTHLFSTSQVECHRMKLPDSLERVRAWQRELNQRPEELLATLRDEGVSIESVFIDEVNGDAYLIYYMRAIDLHESRQTARRSTHAIDEYHQAVMKAVRASNGH